MRENSKQIFREGRGEGEGKGKWTKKVGEDDEEGEIRGTEGEMDGRGGGGEVQAAAGPAIERGTAASTTDGRRWPS